jgi:hypothetical protein
MNPSYLRLRRPLQEAMARYGAFEAIRNASFLGSFSADLHFVRQRQPTS